MKKLVSALCGLLLILNVSAQTSPVTFPKQALTIREIVESLQRNGKMTVMYDDKAINHAAPVKLPALQLPLDQLMQLLREQAGLDVKLMGNNLYIKGKPAPATDTKVKVKGKVISQEDGSVIPGASISADGKVVGVSNANGEFDISVPDGSILTFKAIGLNAATHPVNGPATGIKVNMKNNVTQLDGVIVTALGIKRDEKALGYAVTKIGGEEFTDAMSNNWTNAMSGKVAGLNMLKANGGPGGSTKIVLRGENTFTGTSEALIVVDGVIISAGSGKQTGNGSGSYLDGDSPTDFGTSINDINPEDIESVTVLKGPGASALYGARGSNGAIIVTTKNGRPLQKGLGVTFNSNAMFESVLAWPDYQYEYGQGDAGQDSWYSYNATEDGPSTRSTSSAWGPKFDGQHFYQYDPVTRTTGAQRTPWVPYKNNRKDFFKTGKTFTNSITVEGGNKNTSARLSLTNLYNTWIVPNTGYKRNTVALSLTHKLSDKLQIAAKINYTSKVSDNLPSTGYNNQTIMYFIRGMVPNANIDWFRDYWVPGQEDIAQTRPFSSLLDNPFLQAYEMLNKTNRNGVIGNISATYNFTPDLSVMVRSSLDFSSENRSQQRPKGSQKFVDGMYRTQNIFAQELNYDFMLRYHRKLSQKFGSDFSFGGSRMHNRYIKDELRADKLRVPGIYNFANSKNVPQAFPYRAQYAVNSLYGLFQFSYNNQIFLDFTGRNDWTSTLATKINTFNTSFFYSSVNLSAVMSDMIKLPAVISFWKLRGSLASVGSGGTIPYLTIFGYTPTTFQSGLNNPEMIGNPDLKPMNTISTELGTDIRLFKNRLGMDLTLYRNRTDKQIITAPIDPSTGFRQVILNAGSIVNKGIEIAMNGAPFRSKKGFNWDVNLTFSANRGMVESLPESLDTYIMGTGPANRGSIEARPGGRIGDLYGLGYQRTPDGKIIYNEQGYPLLTETVKYLGNTNPDWRAGISNDFRYGPFHLGVLFDGQFGGVAYSLTHSVLAEEGKLKKTIPGRYNGIIGDGVIADKDGNYRPNDVIATNIKAYYSEHFKRDNIESNTFSTDFIKLREARFDYTFSSSLIKRMKLQRATIGVYGRDLLMFSNWPAFDPEFGTLGNGDISAGFEIGQFPSTRSYGVSLSVGF